MKHTIDSVKELTGRYGSPLYVFDELGFLENAKKLESAMLALYPHYRIAYSFKTNYTPYICSTVKKHGAMAEVVSGFEYELAKRIGFAESGCDNLSLFQREQRNSAGGPRGLYGYKLC